VNFSPSSILARLFVLGVAAFFLGTYVWGQQAAPATASSTPAAAPATTSTSGTEIPGQPGHEGMSEVVSILKASGDTGIVQVGVSLFGGAFVVGALLKLRRSRVAPYGLSTRARELWRNGDFAALEALKESEPSTLARAISFIAAHRHQPVADISAAVGDRVSCEIANFNQLAYPLGVIATIQPLLGLFGMILGMINAFAMVALAGALGNPAQLAGGISQSLATTALGIAFAILFLAAYHFFRSLTNFYGVVVTEEVNNLLSDWLMKERIHAH
jgi:biopolymer transport protein ExbB